MPARPEVVADSAVPDVTRARELDDDRLWFRLGAPVIGADGWLGSSIALLLAPSAWHATDIVFRNADIPGSGRVLPMRDITAAGGDRVDTGIERRQLVVLPRYIVPYECQPVGTELRHSGRPAGSVRYTFAVHEQVPAGLVAVNARARAVDSRGRVVGTIERWCVEARSKRLLGISVRATRGIAGGVFYASEIIGDITASLVQLRLPPAQLLDDHRRHRIATSPPTSGNAQRA
jgi:hypothetical protein